MRDWKLHEPMREELITQIENITDEADATIRVLLERHGCHFVGRTLHVPNGTRASLLYPVMSMSHCYHVLLPDGFFFRYRAIWATTHYDTFPAVPEDAYVEEQKRIGTWAGRAALCFAP